MSRWRETLCGSVMKAAYIEAESKRGLLSGTTEIFSCGGHYLSKPQSHSIKPKNQRPTTIFLPTEQYSIMHGMGNDWNRYEEKCDYDGFEELDVTEVAMRNLDTKLIK